MKSAAQTSTIADEMRCDRGASEEGGSPSSANCAEGGSAAAGAFDWRVELAFGAKGGGGAEPTIVFDIDGNDANCATGAGAAAFAELASVEASSCI